VTDAEHNPDDRRPLKSRGLAVFQWMARLLTRADVSPNAISVTSVVFALGAFAAMWHTSAIVSGEIGTWTFRGLWIVAAVCIQLRLLANMLDGMVAVEGGKASPVGAIYNEVPDRIADPLIIVGAGFAYGGDPHLGYVAAIFAMLIAYIRAVGAHAGAGQQFCGPMAKPQRMALLTVACLVCAVVPPRPNLIHVAEPPAGIADWHVMAWTLVAMIVGELITVVRRLVKIGAALRSADRPATANSNADTDAPDSGGAA